ncbi:MGDG synthase family glycosyltransferase [Phosphitispora sp. TUW77]|uniref:MGDG synthase family glycosyltransferase n=1 Tax=Phosphitispora sp. TUW77 TaxID=3152361 RepID=UPI003AB1758C
MKRILFFSVSIGSGHDLAAEAAAGEVISRSPGCRTMIVDTFKYINPVLNKVVAGSYMESLKFNPKIWGYLYNQAEAGDKFIDLNHILSKLVSVKMEKLIKQMDPQAIICTHAFPAGILSILKSKLEFQIPLIAVMTDYTTHPFWVHENIDMYVLPCEEIKYQIKEYGIDEQKIMCTGIPLRQQFAQKINKQEARKKLGLEPEITLMVMGGGLGLGEIEGIINTLGNADINLQILALTGKNDKLSKALHLLKTENKIKIFGYIDNVAEIMAASDLIITKPGGLTTAEVLAQQLPMIIINPLPGQEDRNTEFLLNNGVAVKVRKLQYLVPQIKYLLKNKTRLLQIKEMSGMISKPDSAVKLVDYIETLTT